MVDWDGLENRCASDGTVGSNPTLSSTSPSRAGKRADFVVLSANPLTVKPMAIKDIKVMATIKDGKTICSAPAP